MQGQNKKQGAFWKKEEVQKAQIDPHDLYIKTRGDKGKVMAHGVFAGMDGQTVHWAMSGWMHIRKAHDTINEYFSEFWHHHAAAGSDA